MTKPFYGYSLKTGAKDFPSESNQSPCEMKRSHLGLIDPMSISRLKRKIIFCQKNSVDVLLPSPFSEMPKKREKLANNLMCKNKHQELIFKAFF